MSLSMNRVILVGHLGKDPEIGETQGNKRYARLSLATSYSYTNKQTGEVLEKTTWHRIVCWGDGLTGFIAEKVKKGNKLLVEGKLQTSSYDKGGVKHYATDVVVQGAEGIVMLLNKPGEGGGSVPPPQEPEGRYAESGYERGSYE